MSKLELGVMGLLLVCVSVARAQTIPLPEHPRPDFERSRWLNLNGAWQFRFDPADAGVSSGWSAGSVEFDETILVPFSWGLRSPVSTTKRTSAGTRGRSKCPWSGALTVCSW